MTASDTDHDLGIDVQAVHEGLDGNAFLFEDPDAYAAGVDNALQVITEQLHGCGPDRQIILDR